MEITAKNKLSRIAFYLSLFPLLSLSIFYFAIILILIKEGSLADNWSGYDECKALGIYGYCKFSFVFSNLFAKLAPLIFVLSIAGVWFSKNKKLLIGLVTLIILTTALYVVFDYKELLIWMSE